MNKHLTASKLLHIRHIISPKSPFCEAFSSGRKNRSWRVLIFSQTWPFNQQPGKQDLCNVNIPQCGSWTESIKQGHFEQHWGVLLYEAYFTCPLCPVSPSVCVYESSSRETERERNVLSGHSAIPVWVFLCTLKCALFKCFH